MLPMLTPVRVMTVAGEVLAKLRASGASTSVPEVRLPNAMVRMSVLGRTLSVPSPAELLTIHSGGIHCPVLVALLARTPVAGRLASVRSALKGPGLGTVDCTLEPLAAVELAKLAGCTHSNMPPPAARV